tara:strand:- start:796 stop:984 length:189 start_codon:yes stop_codon:yes gene_type:complete
MKFLKNFIKSKTKLEKLKDQHKDLLNKAYIASKTNRTLSDTYTFEASKIEKKIIEIKNHENN